jgi:hypothetical protein
MKGATCGRREREETERSTLNVAHLERQRTESEPLSRFGPEQHPQVADDIVRANLFHPQHGPIGLTEPEHHGGLRPVSIDNRNVLR